MKLRTPLLMGLIIGYGLSVQIAPAQAADQDKETVVAPVLSIGQWHGLGPEQRQMVDLLAKDFYENEFSPRQRINVADATADTYRRANDHERAHMRDQRRIFWQNLTADQRAMLSHATSPSYDHLTESQKAPFRAYALGKLDVQPRQHSALINDDSI